MPIEEIYQLGLLSGGGVTNIMLRQDAVELSKPKRVWVEAWLQVERVSVHGDSGEVICRGSDF